MESEKINTIVLNEGIPCRLSYAPDMNQKGRYPARFTKRKNNPATYSVIRDTQKAKNNYLAAGIRLVFSEDEQSF
jgi:hypothetical protein